MTQPSEPRTWYYSAGGESYGPVTQRELELLARAGRFFPDDYIYAPHIGGWVRAKTVHGLFDAARGAEEAPVETPGAPPGAQEPLYVPAAQSPFGPEVAAGCAGFLVRLFAEFMDTVVLVATLWPIVALIDFVTSRVTLPASVGAAISGVMNTEMVFPVVLWLLWRAYKWPYYALMESSRWQGTLGKIAVGLIVTDSYGRRITFHKATSRYVVSCVSALAGLVGYWMAFFTSQRQTLHDLVVGTLVIDACPSPVGAVGASGSSPEMGPRAPFLS